MNEKLINLQSKIKTLTRDRHFTHDVKSMRLGVQHEKKMALTDEYRNLTDAFEYHKQYNVKLCQDLHAEKLREQERLGDTEQLKMHLHVQADNYTAMVNNTAAERGKLGAQRDLDVMAQQELQNLNNAGRQIDNELRKGM